MLLDLENDYIFLLDVGVPSMGLIRICTSQSGPGSNDNEGQFQIFQNLRTRA